MTTGQYWLGKNQKCLRLMEFFTDCLSDYLMPSVKTMAKAMGLIFVAV